MKKLFFIAALTATSFGAFAQKDKEESKTLGFSVGVEGSLPMGTFGDSYSAGFGGSVQGDYKVADKLAITLNAGYISYSGKSYQTLVGFDVNFNPIYGTAKLKSLGLIPVLAGVKYWFSSNVYGSGQLGLSFASGSGTGSNFTYAPGVGVKFSQFDVLLKYTGISATGGSLNAIGLRAAYNF